MKVLLIVDKELKVVGIIEPVKVNKEPRFCNFSKEYGVFEADLEDLMWFDQTRTLRKPDIEDLDSEDVEFLLASARDLKDFNNEIGECRANRT